VDLTKPNQNITIKVGATNFQLQRAIEAALPAAVAQTKDLAKNFKGSTEKETCSKIFNFLMSDITYKVDGDNQKIKLPSAFLREKSGDCKSYSLFTGAILANLKIPFSFTYASYNPKDKTPEHIYVTTKNGCIIDAVYRKFNAEKKPCYKYQKPMNISYISGIKKPNADQSFYIEYLNKDKGFKKDRKKFTDYQKAVSYGKKNLSNFNMDMIKIGNIFSQPNERLSGFQGLGRTGIDWANAVGRDISAGEVLEYLSKNTALAPARGILLMFIRNNGGGIASFLYSLAFRDTPYQLPNYTKYYTEVNSGLKTIAEKYNIPAFFQFTAAEIAQLNAKFTPTTGGGPITPDSIKITPTIAKSLVSVLTPARYAQYMTWRAKADKKANENSAFIAALDKKYPLASRELPSATDASKAKYRGIEWKWFWNLGGSPDDLNEAVKEGNTKSARGKDANYMLNKAYNSGLSAKDLGLVIRGLVSGQAGDKFGLGEEGTYVVAINGQKRIGLDPVTATATAAAITAYSAAIIPIVAFIMKEIRATLPAQKDPSQNPTPFPTGGGDVVDAFSGNTGMILLAAAGVGAYLYLKK
jgi:hypothetical protein